MANLTKILFLCPFSLRQNTGTPIRLKTEIEALSKRGNRQLIVCCERSSDIEQVVFIETVVKKKISNFFPRSLIFWFKSLVAWIKYRPQIVHAVSPITAPVLLLIKLFSLGRTKIVLEVHGLAKYEYRGSKIIFSSLVFFDWLSIKLADHLIAMAWSQKEVLVQTYRVSTSKIEVIWGPVDIEKFSSNQRYTDGAVKKICYTGNDSFWQGVGDIVAVAEKMVEDPVVFELFGFSSWPTHLPLNLKLMGRINYENLFEAVSDCDIFLSTRMDDDVARLQYPQKLSFYLSAGRPVIVSNVGDQQKIIVEEKLGEVYLSGDVEDLLNKIKKICALSLQERLEIEKRAREFAEKNLSLAAFVNKVETVYNRLS